MKTLLIFAFTLFSITAFAVSLPKDYKINANSNNTIISDKCTTTLSMTVSSTVNGSYFGLVGGSITTTVTGSVTVNCAEIVAAGKKLRAQLIAMLPKRADGPDDDVQLPLSLELPAEQAALLIGESSPF